MPLPDAILSRLVARTRELAASTPPHGYGPLRFGAFLFAVAEWLRAEHRSADHDLPPPLYASLEDAIAGLRALPESEDPYHACVAGLLAIEADLCRAGLATNLPPRTALGALAGELPLSGEVLHVVRPLSAWRSAQERRRELRGPMSYARSPKDQLQRLWMDWHPHPQVRLDPGDGARARVVVRRSGEVWRDGAFRVALCPLIGATGPRFDVATNGRSFTAMSHAAPVTADLLAGVIRSAVDTGVALLLLPELHVRSEELRQVTELLRGGSGKLLLVAAGSGHCWTPGRNKPRNAAPLLAGDGGALWTHHKRGLFRLTSAQVGSAPAWFGPLPDVLGAELVEGIECGETLTVLDTGIGRIAVAVCADLLDEEAGFVDAVRTARPAFLLLVSMSPDTEAFERRAEQLASVGISTLYVNATPVPGALSAFAWLALHGSALHAPTRVRWRYGADRADGWWPDKRGADGWEPLPPGAPYARLSGALGLVVDLAEISKEP